MIDEKELERLEGVAKSIEMNSKAAMASAKVDEAISPEAVNVGRGYNLQGGGGGAGGSLVSKTPEAPVVDPMAVMSNANPVMLDVDKIAQQNKQMFERSKAMASIGELNWGDLAKEGLSDRDRNNAYNASKVLEQYRRENRMRGGGHPQAVVPNVIPVGHANVSSQGMGHYGEMQEGWVVEPKTEYLDSGKQRTVYHAVDAISGMTSGRGYLIEEVAERVARVLNHTNNPNDPRVAMINEAYGRLVGLAKERIRRQKAGGNVRAVENQIREARAQLGLE